MGDRMGAVTGSPELQNAKANRFRRRVLLAAILVVAGAMATLLLVARRVLVSLEPPLVLEWSADSGLPVPPDFHYLFFPRTNDVKLVGDNGKSAVLARAIMCSEEEWHLGKNGPHSEAWRAESFGVWVEPEEFRVSKQQVTVDPTVQDRERLIANWQRAYSCFRYPSNVRVELDGAGQRGCRVTLTETQKDASQEVYVYEVIGEQAKPQKYYYKRRAFGSAGANP